MENQENTVAENVLPSWKVDALKELENAKSEKVLEPVTFKKQMFLFVARTGMLVALYLYASDIEWINWIYVIGGLTTITSLVMYFIAKSLVKKKIAKLEAKLAAS